MGFILYGKDLFDAKQRLESDQVTFAIRRSRGNRCTGQKEPRPDDLSGRDRTARADQRIRAGESGVAAA